MDTARLQQALVAMGCDARFDDLTRQLYATDASIYQIEPVGVAFPRSAEQAAAAIRAAGDADLAVIPRGAGTGLAGGAIGDGLVIDFARYNRQISRFDRAARTVHVGPGVVLDQLNAFLAPHGLWFGPDVATSSRATLGGMIANDSSGAHTPVYGTTAEHVRSLDIALADGTLATLGPEPDGLADREAAIREIIDPRSDLIAERLPPGLLKRWPGYGLDRYLRDGHDLTRLIAGSEGTLAAIVSAKLMLVPRPQRRGLGVIFFADVADAMQATVELLDLEPAAIEHIDRPLFDQTRGQLAFRAARDLLRLDDEPCGAILLVEFFDEDCAKLDDLERRPIGMRKLICRDAATQALVWSVRRAGLALLSGCKGPAKPIPGIEDVCVRPAQLPSFVAGLDGIMTPLGIEASYYGHAASGLLHVRPIIDLHRREDIEAFRRIADEVSALTRQFRGSLASEHGVGIARTEFLPAHLGPELMAVTAEVKRLFDPKNRFNPGKIVGDGRYRIDANLRQGAGHEIRTPFEQVLGYVEKDESFVGNLEQCNGNGQCLKLTPSMCPTYIVTHEEIMSTRGRANTIRAALEGRVGGDNPLGSPELDEALSNCLSCKACKTECPSNVDLALLKAELSHARHRREGVSLLDRMVAASDRLGRINCAVAPLTNMLLRRPLVRRLMSRTLGLARERTLPPYARRRFDRWFRRRTPQAAGSRGRVMLWDDTWTRYHDPQIGIAAVRVLEAAGFDVTLMNDRRCCGRPAFSRGMLDEADRLGRHNVSRLAAAGDAAPIIFLEPSCYAMFVDEYRQLRIPRAGEVAARCVLFEHFMEALLEREPDALRFHEQPSSTVAIHAHCHARALTDVSPFERLAARLPGARVRLLDTACCGMAGAFGMLQRKYDLSRRLADPILEQIRACGPDARVVASGTSCRHQIAHFGHIRPVHMAEILAGALKAGSGSAH